MSQFIVHANADVASRRVIPYWLNIQSELIDIADSRVVVPLIAPERAAPVLHGLMPQLLVAGKPWVMDTVQITSVPVQMLGKPVADLSAERLTIIDALDFLINGI